MSHSLIRVLSSLLCLLVLIIHGFLASKCFLFILEIPLITALVLCRSKLKEKTKKADMIRLKKALALDSSFQEADFTNSFFDD